MNESLNLGLHITLLVLPFLAFLDVGRRLAGVSVRLRLAAWLALPAAIAAWLLSGYCAPHPFLTLQHGPMPPDGVFVVTGGALFAALALVSALPVRLGKSENAQL